MSREIRVVFDGPPGPEAGRFVEVEDASGKSINAGEWHERENGWWELRIQITGVCRLTLEDDWNKTTTPAESEA